ncbi:MAG: SHOCT domain-containing protein [Clostridia bacterium]|nr:SHOCT domain-containing protein [Clostridia bacterium]
MNNIEITYVNEGGDDFTLRVEMLTGITVYGQAEKCRELVDLLKEKQILKKLNKADQKDAAPAGQPDVLDQIEKLAKLKEAGILSEEEFAAKKAKLLETL